MKKTFLFLIMLISIFIFSDLLHSQSLICCDDVDSDGNPINVDEYFPFEQNGTLVCFLVKLPEPTYCQFAFFNIYYLDNEGNESFANTIFQDFTNTGVTWFAYRVKFNKESWYRVYVYDCNSTCIASNDFLVSYF